MRHDRHSLLCQEMPTSPRLPTPHHGDILPHSPLKPHHRLDLHVLRATVSNSLPWTWRKRIVDMTSQDLLATHIATQRTLPASLKTQVMNALLQLWRVGEDLSLDLNIRRAARIMWALAPRWAWPEPKRTQGARLPPHARPKLIRAQLTLLTQGKWHECLTGLQGPVQGDAGPTQVDAGLSRPGILTENKLQRLATFARQKAGGQRMETVMELGCPGQVTPAQRGVMSDVMSPGQRHYSHS